MKRIWLPLGQSWMVTMPDPRIPPTNQSMLAFNNSTRMANIESSKVARSKSIFNQIIALQFLQSIQIVR